MAKKQPHYVQGNSLQRDIPLNVLTFGVWLWMTVCVGPWYVGVILLLFQCLIVAGGQLAGGTYSNGRTEA